MLNKLNGLIFSLLKVSLHIYNFCYNSTVIRIIAILQHNNSQITVRTFCREFHNISTSFKCFFQKRASKNIYQKWTFTKKTMILLEAVAHRCSRKQVLLKNLQYSQENTCIGVLFNKVAGLQASNFLQKRLLDKCFSVCTL